MTDFDDQGYKLEYRLAMKVAYSTAVLFRHKYWTRKLYRKLPGRENLDEAEIMVACMNSVAYNLGIYVAPIGSAWALPCLKEDAEKYIKRYDDIWEDYKEWQLNER